MDPVRVRQARQRARSLAASMREELGRWDADAWMREQTRIADEFRAAVAARQAAGKSVIGMPGWVAPQGELCCKVMVRSTGGVL